jgi:hypothetical protein
MGQYTNTYAASHALVIGIDEYKDPDLPPLGTGVKGARAVAETLRDELGFDAERVLLLENEQATQRAIRRAFNDPLGNADKVGPDDRVLIYFGGHGLTYDTAEGEIGCIAPYDIERRYWYTAIAMDELTRLANRIHAKHVLFLLDACFSGFATTREISPGAQRQVDDYLKRPARQVISAGARDQLAADTWGPGGHALFTGFLIDGLRGAAPTPGGVLRAFHLAGYIQDEVATHSHSLQTPQYAALMGSRGGDFVFSVRDVVALPLWLLAAADSDDATQRLVAVSQLRTLAQSDDPDIADQALARLTEMAEGDPDMLVLSSAQAVLRALVPNTTIAPIERVEPVVPEPPEPEPSPDAALTEPITDERPPPEPLSDIRPAEPVAGKQPPSESPSDVPTAELLTEQQSPPEEYPVEPVTEKQPPLEASPDEPVLAEELSTAWLPSVFGQRRGLPIWAWGGLAVGILLFVGGLVRGGALLVNLLSLMQAREAVPTTVAAMLTETPTATVGPTPTIFLTPTAGAGDVLIEDFEASASEVTFRADALLTFNWTLDGEVSPEQLTLTDQVGDTRQVIRLSHEDVQSGSVTIPAYELAPGIHNFQLAVTNEAGETVAQSLLGVIVQAETCLIADPGAAILSDPGPQAEPIDPPRTSDQIVILGRAEDGGFVWLAYDDLDTLDTRGWLPAAQITCPPDVLLEDYVVVSPEE